MKTKTTLLIGTILIINFSVFAQPWFTTGNTVNPTDFLGASNNAAVFFRTNNFPRMMIDAGAGVGPLSQSGGQIGISYNLPVGFTPQGRIHIHHNLFTLAGTIAPFIRFTTNGTGITNTDGFTLVEYFFGSQWRS